MIHTDTGSVRPPSEVHRPTEATSPQASRLRRARWLDPRLITGVLLVLGSVVVGTRVIAAADQTVPVLVAATDLAPGQTLSPELVETRNVLLAGNLDLYYTGGVGSGYVVARAVDEGELLPRSAVVSTGDTRALRYVTVALPATEVPSGLGRGAVVDVWTTPPTDTTDRTATRLLGGVSVTAAESGESGLAGSGGQARVTLAVTISDGNGTQAELDESLGALVAAARDGLVYLTLVPEAAR